MFNSAWEQGFLKSFLYRNAVVAQMEADDLYRDVLDVVDRKNEEVQRQRDQEKLIAEATEKAQGLGNAKAAKALIDKAKKDAEKLSRQAPIDPVLWKRVRKYLRENKKSKADRTRLVREL